MFLSGVSEPLKIDMALNEIPRNNGHALGGNLNNLSAQYTEKLQGESVSRAVKEWDT